MTRSTRMMILGVWLGAAVAHAQTETAPAATPESSTSNETAAPAGPQVQAEIVAVDAAGKTITVRESTEGDATDAAGKTPATATLPVEGNAVTRLGFVKAGSRVTLICAAPAAPETKTTATTTESTTTAAPPAETDTSKTATSTTSATSETSDTSSKSPLNATCGSVVEIAKARATTSAPQQ
jgi:hypothetical protein